MGHHKPFKGPLVAHDSQSHSTKTGAEIPYVSICISDAQTLR